MGKKLDRLSIGLKDFEFALSSGTTPGVTHLHFTTMGMRSGNTTMFPNTAHLQQRVIEQLSPSFETHGLVLSPGEEGKYFVTVRSGPVEKSAIEDAIRTAATIAEDGPTTEVEGASAVALNQQQEQTLRTLLENAVQGQDLDAAVEGVKLFLGIQQGNTR